jgi:hypothetical protein
MARISTPGIWLPGPINTINSTSPSAQADIAGNPFWMGLNAGKTIVLSANEAANYAYPGTTIYDGAYQFVQLDSGATAAYATQGYAAYVLLNSGGPAQGTIPENAYPLPVVTTGDVANTLGLNVFFAGIFINPATVGGLANGPTPGNWTMIFVGAGRAQVVTGSVAAVALGNAVYPDSGHIGKFQGAATISTTGVVNGQGIVAGGTSSTAVAYYNDIIFRFPS